MSSSPMELDVWKGDWGLPSVDLECLRVMTLCKFTGTYIKFNVKNHTLMTGKLPVFRHHKHTHSTFEAVSNYLITKNMSPDFGLSEKQKADAVAFTEFLKEKLYPALLYMWWVDERNHTNLTRKWFCKTIPFPFQFYYPGVYHDQAELAVKALFQHIEDSQVLENEIYEKATYCIEVISARLGTQEFMFGSHPTSLDATLYAYIAPFVKVPFPSGKFKFVITHHSNLVKYVDRISQRYYAAEMRAYEAEKQQGGGTTGGAHVNNMPEQRRNQVIAAGVALLAMTGYAVTTGLLRLQIPRSRFS